MAQVVVAFGVLAFYPPATGNMLLVPIWPGAGHDMVARATDGGALLIGRGPLPGSFVISGDRGAIAAAMLAHGVLPIAAPASGCGAARGVPA